MVKQVKKMETSTKAALGTSGGFIGIITVLLLTGTIQIDTSDYPNVNWSLPVYHCSNLAKPYDYINCEKISTTHTRCSWTNNLSKQSYKDCKTPWELVQQPNTENSGSGHVCNFTTGICTAI